MDEEPTNSFVPGLQGVVAAETRLSKVDGQNGELVISGFPIEELAPRTSFEEVVYLLWHDILPGARELEDFRRVLAGKSGLSGATLDLLVAAAKEHVPVMDALRMAAGTIGPEEPGDSPADTGYDHDVLSLVARTPEIVASYWRMLNGEKIVEPAPDLGYAENYLYMLSGEAPDPEHARALETYLNTVVDHGMNASTFAARVIISTRSRHRLRRRRRYRGAKRPVARRRAGAGARRGLRDRGERKGRTLPEREDRGRRTPHGLRPPRLQSPRPSRRRTRRSGRETLRNRRRHRALRAGAPRRENGHSPTRRVQTPAASCKPT